MEEESQLRASFEEAYDEFLEPIYRYFYWRFNDRDRAKDLAQETFMRAWDYARKGNEIQAMKPFLYATANNLFKNELRSKKVTLSLEALSEEGFEVEDEATPAEERAEARLLMRKLEALNPSYREVLIMRYVDGLPPRDIAAALGESSAAVSVRIHRALKKLRDVYEHHE